MNTCPLCADPALSGQNLWEDQYCAIRHQNNLDHAGYYLVIWKAHIAEMTDLPETQQQHLMRVVFAVEKALRQTLHPEKINLASFGNKVAHLHWHVIARFRNDPHYPEAIWSNKVRAHCQPSAPLPHQDIQRLIAQALSTI